MTSSHNREVHHTHHGRNFERHSEIDLGFNMACFSLFFVNMAPAGGSQPGGFVFFQATDTIEPVHSLYQISQNHENHKTITINHNQKGIPWSQWRLIGPKPIIQTRSG
jgi:hypothetical protein